MDQTPRLRSGAFPQSPTPARKPAQYGGSPSYSRRNQPLPQVATLKPPALSQSSNDPLIPEHILDAPTQRLFVVSFAIALWAWRIWDWVMLTESEEQSLWLFMKWVATDSVFLFGLPGLRIPWLEWSSSTVMLLFFLHAIADAFLMFRIPLPIWAGLAAVGRAALGPSETAVNEHNVNPDAIKFNDSLILGRQIIHILPEGSAILNPEKEAFCIDANRKEARLPIRINSTNPISMELLRTDLETQRNETIQISKSQIKTMHKEASRLLSYSDKPNEPKTLYYTVKNPGLYILSKVVDESNLEVSRKRLAHAVVVPCPRAAVITSKSDGCRGELSNVKMEVVGTPPLTLKYRKLVNSNVQEATFENILPEDFHSPLSAQDRSALVVPNKVDTAWAKPQTIVVPLAESLDRPGEWVYSIDAVRDAFGNNVSYSSKEHGSQERHRAASPHLHQVITVHERPTVNLKGCSPQHPLKAAKGQKASLPIQYGSTGRGELETEYLLEYRFSPQGDSFVTGDQLVPAESKKIKVKPKEQPQIQKPGLYTLTSVSTGFCEGEVLEPASCLLQNPPEPSLTISSQAIHDQCANRPIGLTVDLDLVGTPPFTLHYRMTKAGDNHHSNEYETISGLRGQLELTPKQAGHYTYDFMSISDTVYRDVRLKALSLEQDVKPSAFARFMNSGGRKTICIDDSAYFEAALQGEGPFNIEYELIHGGQRKKYTMGDVDGSRVEIPTEPLREGGDYTLALASVTDVLGCKEFMKDEVRISVRHQKPRVGFRTIDGRRSVNVLEGSKVQLPLRLEGDGPWSIKYLDQNAKEHTLRPSDANERITVTGSGTYRLTEVRDDTCPGVVDDQAKDFEVNWIPRPEMRIPPTDIMERSNDKLVRADVCEGDDDSIEVLFKGAAPYHAHYVQQYKSDKGSMAPKNKELTASTNTASLRMDTYQAGVHQYSFKKLDDANYDHSSKHFTPITVQQQVNPRPSVAFASAGKTYSFCSVESTGEQVIPIKLVGAPPFDLEYEIKGQGTIRPETVILPGIPSTAFDLKIPHSRLHPGKSTVHLRRVKDNNGCVRVLDSSTPRVQISVHDAPIITALESQSDFCVGDPINFALSGVAPFTVLYNFQGKGRKAVATTSTFKRLAEKPGHFTITGIQDTASTCQATVNINKQIHPLPWVKVSKGKDAYVDIHEGSSTDILFEFGGTPPFEFTYTRSSNTEKHGRKAGVILDMHSLTSEESSMRVRASEEGTYEVISIKDRYCSYAKQGVQVNQKEAQKRLTY